MKRIASLFILLFLTGWTSTSAQTYRFDHGPYLQELTNTGVTFVFTTSEKGISWIELKDNNDKITSHYDVKNGLRNAYTTFNTIRVEGLHPNTRYQYRMISKQIAEEIKKFFTKRLFEIVVPRNVRLVEATSYGKPIMMHDPKCTGARAYKALTQEYLNRENKKKA